MEDDRIEDDITVGQVRHAKPSIPSWSNRNMIATAPVEFVDSIPGLKARRVEDRYSQIERARLRVLKAYMQHPDKIGRQWVLIWRGRSQQAATAVYHVMVHDMFRPYREDRYRWFLRRRKHDIWGLLAPRREEEWDDEMREVITEFLASSKRNTDQDRETAEPKDGEFTEQDPNDIIEGLNSQQKSRYKKKAGGAAANE